MCLAIPFEVLRVEDDRAEVRGDSGTQWITTLGLDGLQPGEFVIVHAGHALGRVSRQEAEEILAIHSEIERSLLQPNPKD